jgi:hypothetical protein
METVEFKWEVYIYAIFFYNTEAFLPYCFFTSLNRVNTSCVWLSTVLPFWFFISLLQVQIVHFNCRVCVFVGVHIYQEYTS